MEDRFLKLSHFHAPGWRKFVLGEGVQKRHAAAGAIGVELERIGQILTEGVAVESETKAAVFEAVLRVVIAVRLLGA